MKLHKAFRKNYKLTENVVLKFKVNTMNIQTNIDIFSMFILSAYTLKNLCNVAPKRSTDLLATKIRPKLHHNDW